MSRKHTIILFYPKTERDNINKNIPLPLLKIGSELKNAGYKVVIIDERMEENYIDGLKQALPEALFFGVSSMTGYQIAGGLRASSLVKKINGELPVVWGGWHPSILPEETLANENIDIVVIGQGEATIKELPYALSHGLGLESVDGIAYKRQGRVVRNDQRQFRDINEFGPAAFDLFDFEKYIFTTPLGGRTIFWNSSQGCPYACGFCSTPEVYKRRWSGLSADNLSAQINTLVKRYKIDGITFAEDNFFVDLKRAEDICRKIIDSGIRIKWATDARVDQINRFPESLISLLEESGCAKLYIGAETGDEDVLDLIDKKIRPGDIVKAAEILDKHRIVSEFFMIAGFPLDPEKDLQRSLKLIKDIKSRFPDHQFTPFLYTPYPGTPLLDLSIKKGLRVPEKLEDWQDWSILTVNTPWVNNAYLDKINMCVKYLYPLAFPSKSLERRFSNGYKGFFYRMLRRIAALRVKYDFFIMPLEWAAIKMFYRLKTRFNIFAGFDSFR
ncbi:MAG: radical SAM protein [Candidatus Omnitrophica bacterium]|nr:radical SAM protein [Candidatus Omnitrophota bacterium]